MTVHVQPTRTGFTTFGRDSFMLAQTTMQPDLLTPMVATLRREGWTCFPITGYRADYRMSEDNPFGPPVFMGMNAEINWNRPTCEPLLYLCQSRVEGFVVISAIDTIAISGSTEDFNRAISILSPFMGGKP